MSNGIIYYNRGFSCVPRLLVSLYSLRQFSNAPITIFMDGNNLIELAEEIRNNLNVDIIYDSNPDTTTYVRAVEVCMRSPYDNSIWVDADTTIHDNFDHLFNDIPNYDIVISNFAAWLSNGSGISKRIRRFSNCLDLKTIEDAINYGPAINCGFYGFSKNMDFLQEWLRISKLGEKSRIFIPDEVACQILLPKYKTKILDPSYNVSVKYGTNITNPKIIHYHGRKHCRNFPLSGVWLKQFLELSKINFCNINKYVDYDRTLKKFLSHKYGNKQVVDMCRDILQLPIDNKSYITEKPNLNNRSPSIESDVTIVTACDPKYVECLKLTFPTWIKYKNITKYPMIVYINGFNDNDSRLDFLRKYDNIKLIHWDMHNVNNHREKMLSAFVFGPAKDVKTKYWLKIDCDAYATDDRAILKEEMKDFDIVGHKWSYTKPFEWINTLNKWSVDKNFNFTHTIDQKQISKHRYYHQRTNSFVQLHSTEFIKEAAQIAGDKLPIPSQDTFLWYISCLLNKKVKRYNFKKYCGIFNKRTPEQLKDAISNIGNEQANTKTKINCGKKKYKGWFNINTKILDLSSEESWLKNNIDYHSVDKILAEHIINHLNDEDIEAVILNFKRFLNNNGFVRVAVPDGYHPNKGYIDRIKKKNKILYNYKSLIELFDKYGFNAKPLEYFDENGDFNFKDWQKEDGLIKRSSRYDKRNKKEKLSYTSIIIDFFPKPIS